MLKRIYLIFGILSLYFIQTSYSIGGNKFGIKTVVIDAGHGGNDPGCVNDKSFEKDITLAIALKLGSYIENSFPEIKVIYTRKTDVFVELYKRAQIANDNNADLFISIHCNANKNKNASGSETYVMGLHKSQANLDVAKKENASILLEENYNTRYDGFDPNSPEANIIFSLFQNAYLDQSIDFSTKIQKQFKEKVGLDDRGVKQAGFLVLYKTAMPGVLVETAFLSNAQDHNFLVSTKGQDYIASAIFRAFKEYKMHIEGTTTSNKNNNLDNIDTNSVKPYISLITNKDSLTNKNTSNKPTNNKADIVFKVQIATSAKQKPLDSPEFKNIPSIGEYIHTGLYKYTAGNEKTMDAAVKLQADLQSKGFKDAFVVAFLNGERIPPLDAVKLINKK